MNNKKKTKAQRHMAFKLLNGCQQHIKRITKLSYIIKKMSLR